MDKATLKALKESIKHWKRIIEGVDVRWKSNQCALCEEFLTPGYTCDGCPVKKKTKQDLCEGTPYVKFVQDAALFFGIGIKGRPNLISLATDELNFLKSLLPKENEQ